MARSTKKPTTPVDPDDRTRIVPSRFTYKLHAFHGPSLDLRLEGDRLEFRRSADGYMATMTDPLIVVPSLHQWGELHERLDAIPIWRWKRIESSSQILDGAEWEIDVRYADRRKRLKGYHDLPGNFGDFESAVASLLGLRELEGEPFLSA